MSALEGLIGLYTARKRSDSFPHNTFAIRTRRDVNIFASILYSTPNMRMSDKARDLANAFHALSEQTKSPLEKARALFDGTLLDIAASASELGNHISRRFAGRSE